jgi:hypothetical protein
MTTEQQQKVNESRQKFLREHELLKIVMNKNRTSKDSIDKTGFFMTFKRVFSARS